MIRIAYRAGFIASLAAFVAAAAYSVLQVLQVAGLLHFPLDEILIYGSSQLIALPFLVALLALHYTTPRERKFFSHAALLLATIYVVFVTANYVVQLATVIPAKVRGPLGPLQLLDQYPHSMFWDFDAAGYCFMGLALAAAIPAIGPGRFQRRVRLAFAAHAGITPLILVVYFYPHYSGRLLFLGFPWAITAPLSLLLLAGMFRAELRRRRFHDPAARRAPKRRLLPRHAGERGTR